MKEPDPFLSTAEFVVKHPFVTSLIVWVITNMLGDAFFSHNPRRYLFTTPLLLILWFAVRFSVSQYINTYEQRRILESQLKVSSTRNENAPRNKCSSCEEALDEGDKFCPACGSNC